MSVISVVKNLELFKTLYRNQTLGCKTSVLLTSRLFNYKKGCSLPFVYNIFNTVTLGTEDQLTYVEHCLTSLTNKSNGSFGARKIRSRENENTLRIIVMDVHNRHSL